jgi:nucleoside-diphosphate-sugar epimerase
MRIRIENAVIQSDMENIFDRDIPWQELNDRNILVTGAYGMLASYIVIFLIYLKKRRQVNINVWAQGRSKEKAQERFAEIWNDPSFHFTDMDILRENEEFPRMDYIIHAAGISNPRKYASIPVEVMEPNVVGTYRLLQMGRRMKTKGVLFFSSGDVYGKALIPGKIREDSIGAVDPLEEHSCYSESKRMGESLCVGFYREYGVPTYIARIGHTYAPTMDLEQDPRVFADFMKAIVADRDIVIHGDGRAKRPFLYITDAVAAFFTILLRGKPGEAYNVTNTDQFLSIRELADTIAGIPKNKVNVLFEKRPADDAYVNNDDNLENRPVEDKLMHLGWKSRIDVKSGFGRVYQYIMSI